MVEKVIIKDIINNLSWCWLTVKCFEEEGTFWRQNLSIFKLLNLESSAFPDINKGPPTSEMFIGNISGLELTYIIF